LTFQHVLEWLEALPLSVGIRESFWMFPTIESVHVIAITLVVGSVMVVDLRVLGLTSRKTRVTELSGSVLSWTWAAFVLALLSGSLLFASKAHAYLDNLNFRLKFLVMAAAFANMLLFHSGPYRSVRAWDLGRTPALAKLGCALSLVFWVLIVAMGRWIGFTLGA
jgi:hypothetical protein